MFRGQKAEFSFQVGPICPGAGGVQQETSKFLARNKGEALLIGWAVAERDWLLRASMGAGFISGIKVMRGLTRGSDTESPQFNPPALVPNSSGQLKQHLYTHVVNQPSWNLSSQNLQSFLFPAWSRNLGPENQRNEEGGLGVKEEGHRAFRGASKSLVLEKNREATGITETEAEAVRSGVWLM